MNSPTTPNPEELAAKRRSALLDRARAESWPNSHNLRAMVHSDWLTDSPMAAAKARASGKLLGVWDDAHRLFYYPSFQFCENGRIHPKLQELLMALSNLSTFSAEEDANGWGRLSWLYNLRWSLSERDLAEAAAADGIAENEHLLSDDARMPVEVFAFNPEAVIALAIEDAKL